MSDHDHGHGNHHTARPMERHCDVAIVGGSAAGLAAALQLGRQRRSVIVIDSGTPRNAPAAHMHSYLGYEGAPPSTLTGIGRDEVRQYGGEVLTARAIAVTRADETHFRVDLAGGNAVVARRVLVATGIVDVLPDIDGLAEHWGSDVIHCPFCHGYEVRDRRIVQIVTHPMGLHPAALFRQLTDQLTLVLHEGVNADAVELEPLRAAGVEVIDQAVQRVRAGTDGRVAAVELVDGSELAADAVVVGTTFTLRLDAFTDLAPAVEAHPSGLGDVVVTDFAGLTSEPGVYAAGNVTDPSQQVLQAAAAGSRTAGMIAFSLAHEDIELLARPSANQADWDHRYSGEQIWSGNPNGTLVAEVAGLTPGRALDVGAGEGGDALWLAEQGWNVVASDISQRGLDRIAAEASKRGVEVECLHADANALSAYEPGQFDLVSAQYASIPRTPDDRGLRSLLDAVAPGGSLLVVGHDLEPMRRPADPEQPRLFDPDAYVRVADVLSAIAESPDWIIDVSEKRPRPPGAASSHHVDDVILRARRSA